MHKLLFLLFFIASGIQAQTALSTSEAASLKKKVQEQAQRTQTMTLDFVQTKHMEFLSNAVESSGKLAFRKPNMVKWEYIDPIKYSVLFIDQMLYIDENGKKSDVNLSSNKRFGQLDDLIVNSITGDMFQEKDFEITYLKAEEGYEVVFVPKDNRLKKYIGEFHIFINQEAYVSQVKMVESSGDFTIIKLSNRKVNQSISDQVFAH
ncbi:LolA family protein [Algoriphagus chordae]|uniref:Outer membrane lipoprotein carrier protein n=1 Tax=Algoriphagus chordae TaxID=237019 RepID=A0A2W7QKT0_9BACT|nr:outer membrane lipoprotein carrier protein LolA [Algoriphagus chordae]PZX48721.1 outer membrane lipoprotein carrier protein [Algoriphagus chordae]